MMKGTILTYTILNVTPEGFDAPLYLCVVKTAGENILSYARDADTLKIGRKVNLEKQGEHYYARPLKFKEYFKNSFAKDE
ncbi:MAG: hypothetical protein PF545_05745 [Elusimicrobia bacterium]|jgi:uncharacterized OB-fold protein|nr:hypothetical protein [Elusimicrobiota bacterium]